MRAIKRFSLTICCLVVFLGMPVPAAFSEAIESDWLGFKWGESVVSAKKRMQEMGWRENPNDKTYQNIKRFLSPKDSTIDCLGTAYGYPAEILMQFFEDRLHTIIIAYMTEDPKRDVSIAKILTTEWGETEETNFLDTIDRLWTIGGIQITYQYINEHPSPRDVGWFSIIFVMEKDTAKAAAIYSTQYRKELRNKTQ